MESPFAGSVTSLLVMNVVLATLCGGGVLAVLFAVVLDLRERRQWRQLVPPCWPPPGVDPEAAYAADLVTSAPQGSPSATTQTARQAPHGDE